MRRVFHSLNISDPVALSDNPGLEGSEEDFKIFAIKPTRRGVDFETLVSAFLFAKQKNAPPKKKGQMFETGSAGNREKPGKPKADTITTEESVQLRQNDYKKYLVYLREGRIKD